MKKLSLGILYAVTLLATGGILMHSQNRSGEGIAEADGMKIENIRQLNPTAVEVVLSDGNIIIVDFYADNLFRVFRDGEGGMVRDPQATPPAEILIENPRKKVSNIDISDLGEYYTVSTPQIELTWDKNTSVMNVKDLRTGKRVLQEAAPVNFRKGTTSVTLQSQPGEYFYGGGVQNGRFSHRGKKIAIENQNSWTDGGVASPAPFFWSTEGYGIMFHTFNKGKYDFGASRPDTVSLMHETPWLDMFVMVDDSPELILGDYYQLTGKPVLLPKFGFYEGHLNAYNRDYWSPDSTGILFEDGKRYKESQKDNGGIRETLNGENNNYQFSARAVVDRYKNHDMPLGWILPNDGYGAGYGQTETLDGNIANLKSFGDYARANGVEIGLWTQSDLHPKKDVSALLQRDIVKEVRDAGVRVLKTDVAWVGEGYSFGLNGVADVGEIMPYYGNDARPFIISLDGWAGTQRYAGVWSGDQTGGDWEYIRFHIPTYIGSGLSGQPNITSDMDGIFGGKNPIVNTRDFQWKTFSPMQLNMDGWGTNEKYPHALGEPVASINRNYLKLKSALLPYVYTYAREAVDGKPIIRAMFLDYPNPYTHGISTQYQYLYGPSFLIAPIYQNTAADSLGNDIRNGIYLPEGKWIDYFTGDTYDGNIILNSFEAPVWKLPVFVKSSSIIPLSNPTNNPSEINDELRIFEFYPEGLTELVVYDDDGVTERYKYTDSFTTTKVISDLTPKNELEIIILPTQGDFAGFNPNKTTELIINTSHKPKSLELKIGKSKVNLKEVNNLTDYLNGENVFYYNPEPEMNRFSTPGSAASEFKVTKNPQLFVKIQKTDVKKNSVNLKVKGYEFNIPGFKYANSGTVGSPAVKIEDESIGPYSLVPSWEPLSGADFYEIDFNGMRYTNIRSHSLLFDNLVPDEEYTFKVRGVNESGPGEWCEIKASTKSDPFEYALRGITGESSSEIQEGFEVARLFDFAESGDMFHTKYRQDALPCDLTIDLQSINSLDKIQYLPRQNGGNGTILKGNISVSMDKQRWMPVDSFVWMRNGDVKEFIFADKPQARFIKLHVDEGVGNYVSGRELYVFKVPGTESRLSGDINSDGKIDNNDLMSYTNYTGLRKGDSDFDGYISVGDVDGNGLIDAYDISVVATKLDDGVEVSDYDKPLSGNIRVDIPNTTVVPGDTLSVTVLASDLQGVNAMSFALPYDQKSWKFIGIEEIGLKEMQNLTNDRLHSDGEKVIHPTYVNVGEKPVISTEKDEEILFIIKFEALKKGRFTTQPSDGIMVDKKLNIKNF